MELHFGHAEMSLEVVSVVLQGLLVMLICRLEVALLVLCLTLDKAEIRLQKLDFLSELGFGLFGPGLCLQDTLGRLAELFTKAELIFEEQVLCQVLKHKGVPRVRLESSHEVGDGAFARLEIAWTRNELHYTQAGQSHRVSTVELERLLETQSRLGKVTAAIVAKAEREPHIRGSARVVQNQLSDLLETLLVIAFVEVDDHPHELAEAFQTRVRLLLQVLLAVLAVVDGVL